MKTKIFCFAISLLMLSSLSTAAKNYFVDYTNGNDANAGTIDKPMKSISKFGAWGSVTLQAGDTMYLRAGTHVGHVWFQAGVGTAANPIVVAPYKNEKVIVQSDAAGNDIFSFEKTAQYYVIRDLEIDGGPTKGRFGFNFQNLTAAAYNVKILNCEIHHNNWSAIYCNPAAVNVTIENCVIHDNILENVTHKANSWRCGVNLEGKGHIIRNSHVYTNHGEGIGLYGDGCQAVGNRVHDNWSVNIYICNTLNAVCNGNYINSQNDPAFYQTLYNITGPAVGIMISNEKGNTFSDNIRVVNNIIEGGRFCFHYWKGLASSGLKNSVIANNIFKDAIGSCVQVDANTHLNSKFINNILYVSPGNTTTELVTSWGVLGDDPNIFTSNNIFSGGKYFQGNARYGVNAIYADPVFQSSLTGIDKFRVDQATSPAVDAGIDYTEKLAIDIVNNSRVNGKIDIGPFETVKLTDALSDVHSSNETQIFGFDNKIIIKSASGYKAAILVYTLTGKLLYNVETIINQGLNSLNYRKQNSASIIVKVANLDVSGKSYNSIIK